MLCGLKTPEETLEQQQHCFGGGGWVALKENKEAEKYNFFSNSNIFCT